MSVLSAMAMLLARTGLETPWLAPLGGVGIVVLVTTVPVLWAGDRRRRQVWIGPAALLLLVAISLLLGLLGEIGGWLLLALAVLCLAYAMVSFFRREGRPGIACWLSGGAIVVFGALAASLALGGTKYVNFLTDQLLLHGRTDGDVLLFAAITNALANFHLPSTGVDGLAPVHYHIGFYLLAAGLRGLADGGGALAIIVLQSIVLVPLGCFAVAHGARLIGRRLLPDLSPGPIGLALGSFALVPLLQLSGFGNLTLHSTSMLMGGVGFMLILPAFLVLLPESAPIPGRSIGAAGWWLSVLAVPALSVAKISVGYLWGAVAGYAALRRLGVRRPGFWATGFGIALLFLASFWAFADVGGAGGGFLGRPFYVEYGFSRGDYLLPLSAQWQILTAISCLLTLGASAERRFRRLLIEILAIAMLAANLPGLLMEIPGGDAGYFLTAAGWMALPILALVLALSPKLLRNLARKWRPSGWAALAVMVVALLAGAGAGMPLLARTFVSAAALVHTGDRAYYAADKKKAWRADTERALNERGFLDLMNLPAAEPAGAGLAAIFRKARAEFGNDVAAFIPPQSDFWNLVTDCDGKSLWPMAAAGMPLIEGTAPDQSACPQEFGLMGQEFVPELRADRTDAELCDLARVRGFTRVLRVEGLGGDARLIGCD